jgi:5-methylcytosine-specific restriction endonuclease McrA
MNDFENSMARSCPSSVESPKQPTQIPTFACKSVEKSDSLLRDRVVHSLEAEAPNHLAANDSSERSPDLVEESHTQGSSGGSREIEAKRNAEHMEVSNAAQRECLAIAGIRAYSIRNLKPSELVRLLNSTVLGPVINERQLHRHRTRAPWIESAPKKIDFLKYVAWLHQVRDLRQLRPKPRRAVLQVLTIREAEAILEKQQYRCALSGVPLSPDDLALDHIIPISKGGDFSASNAQFLTKKVNRAKHTMSCSEFVQMCRAVAEYTANGPQSITSIE